MARQIVQRGNAPNDHANAESQYSAFGKINDMTADIYGRLSQTISVGEERFSAGSTVEARTDLAIAQALAELAKFVEFPAFMLPYDISLLNQTNLTAFNAAGGRLTREGGNPDVYDVRAYGAAGDGVTIDTAAQQAAINAVPLNGGIVHYPIAPVDSYLTNAELILPIDRMITLHGDDAFATNQGGLFSSGSIIKRAPSYTSGPLMSQTGVTVAKFGIRTRDIGFDGNNLDGDLLVLTRVGKAKIQDTVFFNSNGNGLLCQNVENSFISDCLFFELGNNTAHPNGKSSLVLNSYNSLGCNTILISQCHWESGRGSYITSYDASGVAPIDIVVIVGGKQEWTGNFISGFDPPAASAVGLPLNVISNGQRWNVIGLATTGGYHTAATHWHITNTAQSRFDVLCSMPNGKTDNQNPRFFVNLLAGTNLTVRGTFVNGASTSAGAGAQIRVVESGVTGYSIADDSQFVTPINGVGIVYTNPTTGKSSRMPKGGAIEDKSFSLTGATSTAINAYDGNYFPVTIGSNIAVVAAIPTNAPPTGQSQEIVIEYFNNSGGALSTAPTFATGTNGFLLPAVITNPANGTSVLYTFRWSGLRSKWLPVGTPQAAGV